MDIKKYENPRVKVVVFKKEDVLTASNPDELPDDEWYVITRSES